MNENDMSFESLEAQLAEAAEPEAVETDAEVIPEADETVGAEEDERYGADEQEDPWSWAKELEPAKVEKTWKRFSSELETVKRRERELEELEKSLQPARELYELSQRDERFLEHLRAYDPARPQEGEDPAQVALLIAEQAKKEIQQERERARIEREFDDVRSWAKGEGYPEPDEVELLTYARENAIGNLKAAYRDKFFDDISEAKKKRALDDIKRSKNAQTVTQTASGDKSKPAYSEDDLANMSDAEFQKNFADIFKSLSGKRT